MKLYYVRADDDNGENADAYVYAKTPRQAASLCRRYWERLAGEWEQMLLWVDEVPVATPAVPGVVAWEHVKRHQETVS